jgi:transposase
MIAPCVLDGRINRNAFKTYVGKVLVPELRKGDVVVMDNLSSHKAPRTRELIEAAGASLSTCRPIRPTSIRSKRLSPSSRPYCKVAERTVDGLLTAIGRLLDLFTLAECTNYFAGAGYDAT